MIETTLQLACNLLNFFHLPNLLLAMDVLTLPEPRYIAEKESPSIIALNPPRRRSSRHSIKIALHGYGVIFHACKHYLF